MISLFIKVLPYFFLLYFILRFLREPLYLLGIPFLLFLRSSIFFENIKIFTIPGRFGPEVLLLVWLVIIWLLISSKSKAQIIAKKESRINITRLSLLDYIMLILILISIVGLAFVLKENYVIDDVLTEFITLVSLFLGYFIIKNIIQYTDLDVLSEFLYTIVIINTIASLLYFVHQGLHITLYTSTSSDEYMEEFFQGELITRTFWFMPVLWFFSISYLLVFKRNKPIEFGTLLSINLLAIFISYTRSFLIISVLLFVIYFLFTGYKQKDIGNIIKNLLLIGVAGILLFVGISTFLPASKNYFLERFKELDKNSSEGESNNLIYRFENTGDVISQIDANKVVIGHGPLTETQMPFVAIMRATTADMAWTGVIFRWGYLGMILFVLLYIVSIIKAYFLFMRTEGIISNMALFLLLIVISQSIESFTSWTFLSPNRYAMGLWYFGMLSALLKISKEQDVSVINE